ncbi:hypothetical protein [Aeromicrobium sp. 9AM]|uniref:hypothetical protein n=1 Tax=Aeromicrobium sp. 9AM TaxID=2653126 RepID=UPI0012F09541|nr:hypothetical protein [Aeromicrobium sp. 9AM]VXB05011.1 hypothetical protein AERO9AM_10282 [Aeromicrobium sp. 9AM]
MSEDTTIPPVKIPALPDLARMPAVRKFKDALMTRGHHAHAANAISLAVCDPAAARRQLDEPGRMRVEGGYLEVVHVDVWTPALIPYPVNPRTSTTYAYPAEDREDRKAPLPDLVPALDDAACELVIPPMPTVDLISALDAQTEYLRATNNLQESVGLLGIRQPMLLLPLVVASPDSEEWTESKADTAVLSTVDGSSRLTAAYAHLDVEPSEVLLRLAPNERALRQRVGNVLTLAGRSLDALSDEEISQLRVIAAPASIIVGFVRDDSASTLADAIYSRLGTLHVDPPRPWSTSNRLDVQLDVALRALESAGRIEPAEAAWLGAHLDAEETRNAGFRTDPDVRAAYLLKQLGKRDSITSQALRALTSKSKVTPRMRAELVAEGTIRSFRSSLTDSQITSTRALLTAIYQMDELQSGWTVQPRADLAKDTGFAADAVAELETVGGPGPHIRRVLALASYWLARHRVIARQTRGGQEDRRDITAVLSLMVNDEHGVRQLIAVIHDGRSGQAPRRIDAAGGTVVAANGEPVLLDSAWIRQTWQLKSDEPETDEEPLASPAATLLKRQNSLALSLKGTREALKKLDDPKNEDGTPLVETLGLPPEFVASLLSEVVAFQQRLLLLGVYGSARTPDDLENEDL